MESFFSCCNSREEEGQLSSKIDRKSFIIEPIVHTYQSIGANDKFSMHRRVQKVQKDVLTVKLAKLKRQTLFPIKIMKKTFSIQNSTIDQANQKQKISFRSIPPFFLCKNHIKINIDDNLFNIATALSLLSRKSEIINSIINKQQNNILFYLKVEGKIHKITINQQAQSQQSTTEEQMQTEVINKLIYLISEGMNIIYEKKGLVKPKLHTIGEIMEAITFAPNLIIQIQNKNKKQKEQLWNSLMNHIQMNRIIICKTKQLTKILLFEPNSYYTLVLPQDNSDTVIIQQRKILIENLYKDLSNNTKQHSFSIDFKDFFQNINTIQVHTSLKSSFWISQQIQNYKKGKCDHLQLYITEQSTYNIKITQSLYHSQQIKSSIRGTLILFEKHSTTYQYINGSKTKHQQSTVLSIYLKPGKYILYCKIDKQVQQSFPNWARVQIYSQNQAQLLPVKDLKYKSLIAKGFLSYAQKNKRQLYEHGLMWMSFQQLQNCDYAFVAFGNKIGSVQQFKVTFNQQDFHKCGYKLKKPFKGKKIQQLFINPGEQRIILCRKINDQNSPSKFPPKMEILKIPIPQPHPFPHQL